MTLGDIAIGALIVMVVISAIVLVTLGVIAVGTVFWLAAQWLT